MDFKTAGSETVNEGQRSVELVKAELHNKRQATQHGCLPSLLGSGDKGTEIVYGEEKYILYWAD
jgi:hypothetical protein